MPKKIRNGSCFKILAVFEKYPISHIFNCIGIKNSQYRIEYYLDLEFCPFFFRDAESLVYTYKKEMRDMETQLKQQQNLYSAVRNDRTGLAKSLTEAQDEISDLKV